MSYPHDCWELKLQIQRDIAGISETEKIIAEYETTRDSYSYVCYTDYIVRYFTTYELAKAQYDEWLGWQPTLHEIITTAEYFNPLISDLRRGLEKLRLQIADEQNIFRQNCEQLGPPPGEPPTQPPPTEPPPELGGGIVKGCFILTAIGNQPLIDKARDWRDTRPLYYKPLILLYYILSPPLAKAIYYSKRVRAKVKPVIEKVVGAIIHER